MRCFVALDFAEQDLILRIVLPHSLKMGVFGAHGVGGVFGEGSVHDDGAFAMVETKGILHCYVPPI